MVSSDAARTFVFSGIRAAAADRSDVSQFCR